jgi:hypothetical protein
VVKYTDAANECQAKIVLKATGREPLHNLASLGTPVISGVLAEACRCTGRVEDGGVVLGEPFAVADIADVCEMEWHRLTGEVWSGRFPGGDASRY